MVRESFTTSRIKWVLHKLLPTSRLNYCVSGKKRLDNISDRPCGTLREGDVWKPVKAPPTAAHSPPARSRAVLWGPRRGASSAFPPATLGGTRRGASGKNPACGAFRSLQHSAGVRKSFLGARNWYPHVASLRPSRGVIYISIAEGTRCLGVSPHSALYVLVSFALILVQPPPHPRSPIAKASPSNVFDRRPTR